MFCKYSKNLKLIQWSDTVLEIPANFKDAERRDLFWAFSHFVYKETIPVWIGYNSKTVKHDNEVHKVTFLRNYNEDSTNPSMILETLRITDSIANECGQNFAVVTYVLAMAKPAMQIQSLQSPTFDKMFIHFGAFHLFMAYFAALGKIMSESGCAHILCESGILADNSMKGFMSRRHFNRCKRLHPLLALALQLQHIKFFLSSNIHLSPGFELYLMNSYLDRDYYSENECPSELIAFLSDAYRKTWANCSVLVYMYIDYVHLYLKMSRAVRMNDVDLFTL
ncbi:unnamed protein product [Psylliodes chrysocephalus]|uniref:Uncharacterized protein n=1 Tax=Psylliodes chrysocephalus TaxID=3402493 RepID=A0A9P0GAQ0_9CUCU|nr:unnamed protein product [Psylliodes chrysocephala]